jgi:hypothetical protein
VSSGRTRSIESTGSVGPTFAGSAADWGISRPRTRFLVRPLCRPRTCRLGRASRWPPGHADGGEGARRVGRDCRARPGLLRVRGTGAATHRNASCTAMATRRQDVAVAHRSELIRATQSRGMPPRHPPRWGVPGARRPRDPPDTTRCGGRPVRKGFGRTGCRSPVSCHTMLVSDGERDGRVVEHAGEPRVATSEWWISTGSSAPRAALTAGPRTWRTPLRRRVYCGDRRR